MNPQQDNDNDLDPGESYCSPEEEQLLHRVMAAVYGSVNGAKQMRSLESWFVRAPDLGVVIGHVAFKLLLSAYKSAQQSGVQIPATVFLAQGGAVYQTIDMLIDVAKHCHIQVDENKAREDAMGIVLDSIRQGHDLLQPGAEHAAVQQQQGQQQGRFPQQAAAANPLSHAVNQGLQQQGLLQ